MPSLPNPHPAFLAKKSKILSHLSTPLEEYVDASPKGSVDVGIRDLIDEINRREGLVTTSSCAGRVSVFVEGAKGKSSRWKAGVVGERHDDGGEDGGGIKPASTVGGKGGGGAWLFVSHDPVPVEDGVVKGEGGEGVLGVFGLDEGEEGGGGGGQEGEGGRLIHFKFEPMILHILTASPSHAQLVLNAGLQAGFRESGAVSLLDASTGPMVAIRSMGLGFESLVGVMDAAGRKRSLVSQSYLEMLVRIGNERFVENERRIGRFLDELRKEAEAGEDVGEGEGKEDKEARRERKRAEGLRRQAEEQTEGDKARRRRSERMVEQIEFYIDDLARDRNLS